MSVCLLNLTLYAPLLGAVLLIFIPRSRTRAVELLAFVLSLVSLVAAAGLWGGRGDYSYTEARFTADWIPSFNIHYSLGLDGFSMPMVFLTALLTTVCLAYSRGRITTRVSEYYFLMLLLECFLVGVFEARDLFLFYVLFDAALIPMYFLILLWGGENRERAALKFLLYTLAGSAALLIGVLWLYFASAAVSLTHQPTFDISVLSESNVFALQPYAQDILFFLFAAAFAVKIPIFPVHTWLPDAYVEAPTAVTAMLAGVMGKMGVYGFLRLALPLFPEGAHNASDLLMVLGVISILYGAFVALAQWDLKRLVAYSSVSHMGFIALGLAVAASYPGTSIMARGNNPRDLALSGVVLEMFAHGIITGALFLLVGLLADKTGIRNLHHLTGAMRKAPVYVVVFSVVMFASMGMPGLMGFWGELYVLVGAFPIYPVGAGLAALGIVITAGFFIWALQRMAFGAPAEATERLVDVNRRELLSLSPLIVLMFLFGVLPGLYLDQWTPAIHQLLTYLK